MIDAAARGALVAVAIQTLVGCSASRPANSGPLPLDTSRIIAADTEPQNWLTHGREVARGAVVYGQNCLMCHGVAAAGGAIADLRRSARLHDATAWRDVVLNGIASAGMPRFSGDVSEQDIELVRASVARQAAAFYAQEQTAKKAQGGS